MARFRNLTTGAVVRVDDEKAPRFVTGWEPADRGEAKPAKKSAPRKRAVKKSAATSEK